MITKGEFFKELNTIAATLQFVAGKLTRNQEDAQALYLETIYQGMKNRNRFGDHTGFSSFILFTMKSVFRNDNRFMA